MAIDVKEYLESVREKKRRVARMETALAENRARAEQGSGLQITEKVQTSNKATIDATLAAIEEEKQRLEEAQKELEDMLARAREMIDLIRDDETAWQILWERYIMGETWSAIARKINYSLRTVHLVANAGLEKINERLHTIAHDCTSLHIKIC